MSNIIRLETIRTLLLGQEDYIQEFATASIQSFTEFSGAYRNSLLSRDMETLRRAGHKIKPVASMLDVHSIVDEYKRGKHLLEQDRDEQTLKASADKVQRISRQVVQDFEHIIDHIKEKNQ